MKFSGKMCFMIISKFTKNEGFTLCLEDAILKKPQGVSQPPSHTPAVLGLSRSAAREATRIYRVYY